MEGVTGEYFADCRPVARQANSYDEEVAKRLWDVSLELTGVTERVQLPEALVSQAA
jgi:hypothetical protein